MKTLIASSLTLSLMSGVALAQTTTPPAPSRNAPSATEVPVTPRAPATAKSAAPSPHAMSTVPAQSTSVSNWYKQTVYDTSNASIGQVMDVLLSPDGKVAALIIGVGGFLGMGDHDVAIPFDKVKYTQKDGRIVLTADLKKDELKNSPGLRYDNATTTWIPE